MIINSLIYYYSTDILLKLVAKNVQVKNILNNLHCIQSKNVYDESNIKEYHPNKKF